MRRIDIIKNFTDEMFTLWLVQEIQYPICKAVHIKLTDEDLQMDCNRMYKWLLEEVENE